MLRQLLLLIASLTLVIGTVDALKCYQCDITGTWNSTYTRDCVNPTIVDVSGLTFVII